jgi:hypothetical protein
MSSSCRSVAPLASALGWACILGLAGSAHAAQTFVQPQADARIEANTNLGMDPDGSEEGTTEGYIADLQLLMGYATPRSETTIRPRVRLQEYPDRDDRDKVEGFLDWVTRYKWERSRFDFVANYRRQDAYNYDTRSGEFDELDPNDPNAGGAGRFLTDETRTELEFRPSYSFDLTERLSLGVGGNYQETRFDADQGQPDHDDYNFWLANADLRWALDERSTVGVGAFFSQYDPKSGGGDSDGYGAGVLYGYDWSEVMGVEVTVGYQVDDPKYPVPGEGDQTTSSVGGSIAFFGEGQVSSWRLFASQRYAPSSYGQMRQIDQLRFQYDRQLTQRLSVRGMARYENQEQLDKGAGGGRDTGRLDASLKWDLSRTWFVQGGYAYIWQKEADEDDGYNNRFYVGIAYKGLGRERSKGPARGR